MDGSTGRVPECVHLVASVLTAALWARCCSATVRFSAAAETSTRPERFRAQSLRHATFSAVFLTPPPLAWNAATVWVAYCARRDLAARVADEARRGILLLRLEVLARVPGLEGGEEARLETRRRRNGARDSCVGEASRALLIFLGGSRTAPSAIQHLESTLVVVFLLFIWDFIREWCLRIFN